MGGTKKPPKTYKGQAGKPAAEKEVPLGRATKIAKGAEPKPPKQK